MAKRHSTLLARSIKPPSANTRHGHCRRGTVSPEYEIWRGMKARCYNKRKWGYKWYGARGIVVCKRWRTSFENFLADMGLRPGSEYTIERVNNDRGYSPSNCVWATMKVQANNSRKNRRLTHRGETLTLSQWAERLKTSESTIRRRLRDGWSVDAAISIPIGVKPGPKPFLTTEQLHEQRLASRAMWYAVRSGKIRRPACCEQCHRKTAVWASHPRGHGRAARLTVRWLCPLCHRHARSNHARV